MEYKLYRIKWIDSTSYHGWVLKDDLDKEVDLVVNSVSFLLRDFEDRIFVSSHISNDCVDSPITIPKCAILEMVEIKIDGEGNRNMNESETPPISLNGISEVRLLGRRFIN